MKQFEGLETTLQTLCNISAEDSSVPAEILRKVLGVCSENKQLRSKVEDLQEFSQDLINRLEIACRDSERMHLLEQQLSDSNSTINALKEKAIQKDNSIEDLEKQLSAKDSRIYDLTEQLSQKKSEVNSLHQNVNDLDIIRKNYEMFDILPFYEKLSDKMKSNLSNIFPNSNNSALLSSGIQENNILRLYAFLEDRVKEDIWDDYEPLNIIVRKLFEIYNVGRKEPFSIIDPIIGSQSISEEHRIKGNSISGTITKTLLFGYKRNNGEVKAKAFVSVN